MDYKNRSNYSLVQDTDSETKNQQNNEDSVDSPVVMESLLLNSNVLNHNNLQNHQFPTSKASTNETKDISNKSNNFQPKNNSTSSPPAVNVNTNNKHPSESWNYDNFIEKPRSDSPTPSTNKGHIVQPRFLYEDTYKHRNTTTTTRDIGDEENGIFRDNSLGNTGVLSPDDGISLEIDPNRNSDRIFLSESHTSIGLSPTLLAIIAYFFGWLGGLIVMVLERKNLFVLFHAWQSIACGLISFVIQFLFFWSKSMYTVLWIAYLLFTCYMIGRVIKDSPPPTQTLLKVPIIGDWAEKRAFNKIQYHTRSLSHLRL